MHTPSILTALVLALTATVIANPVQTRNTKLTRSVLARDAGGSCAEDSDCPSDKPYCICAYQAPTGPNMWEQVYACSAENCDGCLDAC